MPSLSRNLLLVAALGSFAPAVAHPLISDCEREKASGTVILTDPTPSEVPISESRRAFLP